MVKEFGFNLMFEDNLEPIPGLLGGGGVID